MLSSRLKIELIAGALILFGVGLTVYKVFFLGFPLLPGEYREVWTIETKISFQPESGAVDVELTLPEPLAGWEVLDEHFASSGFGFAIRGELPRRANWTRQTLERPTTLYYKLQAYRPTTNSLPYRPPDEISPPLLGADQQVAMERLLSVLRQKSVDAESFTALLLAEMGPEGWCWQRRFWRLRVVNGMTRPQVPYRSRDSAAEWRRRRSFFIFISFY